MLIRSLSSTAIYQFPAFSVAPGGRSVESVIFPLLSATSDHLPEHLDALLCIGDLQAVASVDGPPEARTLSGIAIAEELAMLAECGLLPDCDRTAVLLTGDLYTVPDLSKRGGTGDVRPVWSAFIERFGQVIGVAGNHDLFGDRWGPEAIASIRRGHLLDDRQIQLGSLTCAGISGIIGPERKPWRRAEPRFLEAMGRRLQHHPDLLLLHEAPASPLGGERGQQALTRHLEAHDTPLTVLSGHARWSTPLVETERIQYLNLDGRLIYVTRDPLSVI